MKTNKHIMFDGSTCVTAKNNKIDVYDSSQLTGLKFTQLIVWFS